MILKKTAKDGNYNMWSIKIPGKKTDFKLKTIQNKYALSSSCGSQEQN